MTFVEVNSGLANRLRVIDSCIHFARIQNINVLVFWVINDVCGAGYHELFFQSKVDKRVSIVDVLPNDELMCEIRCDFVYKGMYYKRLNCSGLINGRLPEGTYIDTCYNLAHVNSFEWVEPVYDITEMVDRLGKKLLSNCIGIHVRRTDHAQAREYSPTFMFEDRIEELIQKDSNTTFFVASDDYHIKSRLEKNFGDHIFMNSHLLSRDSLEGIINSVVDMICLSYTRHIIGSYKSTYAGVAAYIGKTSYEYLYFPKCVGLSNDEKAV
jgi:hypothetical protein